MNAKIDAFRQFLIDAGKSERTVSGYLADLEIFSRWFQQTNGEMLSSDNLTPTDVREYKLYLLNVQKAKAATINRHLAAIRLMEPGPKILEALFIILPMESKGFPNKNTRLSGSIAKSRQPLFGKLSAGSRQLKQSRLNARQFAIIAFYPCC